jgi:hypothetical protein
MVCPSDDQDEQAERVEEYGGLLDVIETPNCLRSVQSAASSFTD